MPSAEIKFSGMMEPKFGSSKTEFRSTTVTISADKPISEYFDYLGPFTFKPNGDGTVHAEFYYRGSIRKKNGETEINFRANGKDPRQLKLFELAVGGPTASIVNKSNGNRLELKAV